MLYPKMGQGRYCTQSFTLNNNSLLQKHPQKPKRIQDFHNLMRITLFYTLSYGETHPRKLFARVSDPALPGHVTHVTL